MNPGRLDGLLTPEDLTARFQGAKLPVARAVPVYVRHKPGGTTIVGLELEDAEGRADRGYLLWCDDAARVDAVHAKAITMRLQPSAIGPGVARIDRRTVVYGFPNDARLRRMRWYTSARKLRRSLEGIPQVSVRRDGADPRILRYKPQRRVVVATRLVLTGGFEPEVVLRLTASPRAGELAAAARHLSANGVATPRPIAQLEGGRVGIDHRVPGSELRQVVLQGRSEPAGFAADLARFHRIPPGPATVVRSAAEVARQAQAALAALGDWHPTHAGPATHVAAHLERLVPGEGPAVLTHGDLHGRNVLRDGDTHWFLDLDRSAGGSPAVDLGCYLAHAIALAARGEDACGRAAADARLFVESYRRGRIVTDEELAWYTAVGLVEQALLVHRHVEPDRVATATHLLDLARLGLERPADVLTLHGHRGAATAIDRAGSR